MSILPFNAIPGEGRPGQILPGSLGWGSAYTGGVRWEVGNYAAIGMNHLSTQYIFIPVLATKSGLPYNPTSDVVQFAFAPTATYVPQNADWQTGSWDTDSTNVLYPYSAKCLVGPAGTITLGIGTYVIYLRITDNPEVPVLVAGQLQVS